MQELTKISDADLAKHIAGLKAKIVAIAHKHQQMAEEQRSYIEALRPFSLEQERRHAIAIQGKTSREIRAAAKKS